MTDRTLVTNSMQFVSRYVLGAVFIFASLDKIHNPDASALSILHYQIIGPSLTVTLAAIFMPWTELVAGFCLVLGIYKRGSSAILFVFLVVFVLVISQALVRNLDIACGCFTQEPVQSTIGISKLLEDVFLGALAFITFWVSPAPSSEKPAREEDKAL